MRPGALLTVIVGVCVLMASGAAPAGAASVSRSNNPATKPAAKPVIAVFALHGEIVESSPGEEFPLFGEMPQSLKDLLTRMRKAGDDENVKAMALMLEGASMGYGQSEEIRQAI